MKTPQFELISFNLCPYVQRSKITLNYKKISFATREVDLENPPEWFLKISPMGKVPVLLVDEKTPLFESAVINEYLDDVTEPHLNPRDPLQKALERSWIEYGSDLFMSFYMLAQENDPAAIAEGKKELFSDLQKLEAVLNAEGPFFRGKEFSLVDTSYAPFFMRMNLLPKLWNDSAWSAMPKVKKWANTLLELPAVKASVHETFASDFAEYLKELGTCLL